MANLIKVTTTEDEGLFFNADLIRTIVPPTSGKAYALIYLQGTEKDIEIPSSEWERIAPLLTGEQTPAETPIVPTDTVPVRWRATLFELAFNWYKAATGDDSTRAYDAFEAYVDTLIKGAPAPQAPSLPTDVIAAQKSLLETISKPWNCDGLFDAAYALMTTVGKHIPAEGDVS
jgi:hypothetical protein